MTPASAVPATAATLGILGGTFDPIHLGHIAAADAAQRALSLERILLIPSRIPPHRTQPATASAEDRVKMAELAAANRPGWSVSRIELDREGKSYTYDTLVALRKQFGSDVPWYMLIGSDQYEKLGTWHRAEELLSLANFAVFARPGWDGGTAARKGVVHVPMERLPISGSAIRAAIARGDDVSALLPGPVLEYIRRHRLYGHP